MKKVSSKTTDGITHAVLFEANDSELFALNDKLKAKSINKADWEKQRNEAFKELASLQLELVVSKQKKNDGATYEFKYYGLPYTGLDYVSLKSFIDFALGETAADDFVANAIIYRLNNGQFKGIQRRYDKPTKSVVDDLTTAEKLTAICGGLLKKAWHYQIPKEDLAKASLDATASLQTLISEMTSLLGLGKRDKAQEKRLSEIQTVLLPAASQAAQTAAERAVK